MPKVTKSPPTFALYNFHATIEIMVTKRLLNYIPTVFQVSMYDVTVCN